MRARLFGLALVMMVALPAPALAGNFVTSSQHQTWQNSELLDLSKGITTRFAGLSTGQARFYRLSISQPTKLTVVVSVSPKVDQRFLPSVILFQPELQTTGPALPLEQPPNTLASVYPGLVGRTAWHWKTQTSSRTVLSTQLSLTTSGDYYLAVYNPSKVSGVYQVKITTDQKISASNILDYPSLWWYTQVWAGWGLASLLLPLVVLLIAWLIWWAARTLTESTLQIKTHVRKKS